MTTKLSGFLLFTFQLTLCPPCWALDSFNPKMQLITLGNSNARSTIVSSNMRENWTLRSSESATELPGFMIWQTFRTPKMDCIAAQAEFEKIEVPRQFAEAVYNWSSISCPHLGEIESITFVHYLESSGKEFDGEFANFLSQLTKATPFGAAVKINVVKNVVAINSLITSFNETDTASGVLGNRGIQRVELYSKYSLAIEGFTRFGKSMYAKAVTDFLTFLESYLSDEYLFQLVRDNDLPLAKLIVLEAFHHVVLDDGRSFSLNLRPFYERDCKIEACY